MMQLTGRRMRAQKDDVHRRPLAPSRMHTQRTTHNGTQYATSYTHLGVLRRVNELHH